MDGANNRAPAKSRAHVYMLGQQDKKTQGKTANYSECIWRGFAPFSVIFDDEKDSESIMQYF
jgi:hypothetical protein